MKLVAPHEVEPLVNEGYPPEAEGKVFHRRLISATTGGPRSIDIDYNEYAGNLGGRLTYAYTKDEFCYQASGRIVTESRGVVDDVLPGTFMWRPAGAATDAIEFVEDSVTICAFGPAREDEWSHRLAPEVVGEWDGDEMQRHIPTYRHFSDVEPTRHPAAPDEARIAFRRVFSSERDGSRFMDLAHITFDEGAAIPDLRIERDEIWWLESGGLEIDAGEEHVTLRPPQILSLAPGERIESLVATEATVLISYSAPPVP